MSFISTVLYYNKRAAVRNYTSKPPSKIALFKQLMMLLVEPKIDRQIYMTFFRIVYFICQKIHSNFKLWLITIREDKWHKIVENFKIEA